MIAYILVILLLILACATLLLIKELEGLPIAERRRRARIDGTHKRLYALRAHGLEGYLVLWTSVVGSVATAIMLLRQVRPLIALPVVALLITLLFVAIPYTKVSLPLPILSGLAGAYERIANWLAPFYRLVAKLVRPILAGPHQAQLFEKDDLVALLHAAKRSTTTRIAADDLRIAQHALTFGDKHIRDYLTPRRSVKMIQADDQIGPVLLDELHSSGFSRFPVYDKATKDIIGTLHIKDIVGIKDGRLVRDALQRHAYFVHQDLTLSHALKAFLKSKQHMFVVVNNNQETVGVITIEDVLEQILGKKINDEFEAYDDRKEVSRLGRAD